MGTTVCGNQHSCPECDQFDRLQRETRIQLEEELVKLRTGLARLAFRVGIAEHVPGKPGREAPFEVLEKVARSTPRGWNALIGVLMDEYGKVPAPVNNHEPGCESHQGKQCSCSPYNVESKS